MRNNQLELALVRAGFIKIKEAKPTRQTHGHHVHEIKPTWESLSAAEKEIQFNALTQMRHF